MKITKTTIAIVLAVVLLMAANAVALPRILASALAMPQGEVMPQTAADTAERLPLPTPPEGIGGYELVYSRPFTEEEQQRWDLIPIEEPVSYLESSFLSAGFVYTERAAARLRESLAAQIERGSYIYDPPRTMDEIMGEYRIGEAAPGEYQIDIGTITMVLPDEIDDRTLLKLYGSVHVHTNSEPRGSSWLQEEYDFLFADYRWVHPETWGPKTDTRGLCPQENERYYAIWDAYVYDGLRAGEPLLTSAPADDAMWYDESANTLHLPSAHQLTDDEMLQHLELGKTLSAKAVVDSGVEAIPESEALERAEFYLRELFALDIDDYVSYTMLNDDMSYLGETSEPEWYVGLHPKKRPRSDMRYDGSFSFSLAAQDGSLYSAHGYTKWPEDQDQAYTHDNKPPQAVRDAWGEEIRGMIERVYQDVSISKIYFERYLYDGLAEAGPITLTSWAVRLEDGGRFSVYLFADGSLSSIDYEPAAR